LGIDTTEGYLSLCVSTGSSFLIPADLLSSVARFPAPRYWCDQQCSKTTLAGASTLAKRLRSFAKSPDRLLGKEEKALQKQLQASTISRNGKL
jgi:hypothetical protein